MDANYSAMVESVKAAIKASKTADSGWDSAGKHILAFYQSPQALIEVKAQFCADVIIPMLDKRHRDALALEIPRKGSKLDTELEKNEAARESKKSATATRDTMFMYALKKAWPEYGKTTPAATAPKVSDSDKFRNTLTTLIKQIEDKQDLDFAPDMATKHLRAALAAMVAKY